MNSKEPLTRDAVLWGYRLLLGREPESDGVVDAKLAGLGTVGAFVADLLHSEEFRRGSEFLPLATTTGNEPPIRVESEVSPGEMETLFQKVSKVWRALGESEPHWSVITSEKFLQKNLQSYQEEFDALGARHFDFFEKSLNRNGIELSGQEVCLELGCGVGRVSRRLAEKCGYLIGYDISDAHLGHARKLDIGNAEFRCIETLDDFDDLPEFDLFYSLIVLQHNPPPLIERILDRVFNKMKRGGVGYFQLPTYRSDYAFSVGSYLSAGALNDDMEMHYLPQERVFALMEKHSVSAIQIFEDDCTGRRFEEISNTFLVKKR